MLYICQGAEKNGRWNASSALERCVMRRKTGNSEKKKQRWRLTAARQDPCELENLQMILSLVDDADEEFMEDVMLKEAEPFEV